MWQNECQKLNTDSAIDWVLLKLQDEEPSNPAVRVLFVQVTLFYVLCVYCCRLLSVGKMLPAVLLMWLWQVAIPPSTSGLPEASWASPCQQESPSSRDPASQHLREIPVEKSCISDCALVLQKTLKKVTSWTIGNTPSSLCFASSLCANARTKSLGCYLELCVCWELIGLSHLVIWDSERVHFAHGILCSFHTTDDQDAKDPPLLVDLTSPKVSPGSHKVPKFHLLTLAKMFFMSLLWWSGSLQQRTVIDRSKSD